MIDVYSIGSTLKITDLVTPHLVRMAEQFAKIDAIVLQVNKRLQKMGAEVVGVRNLATAAKALDGSLKAVGNGALIAEKNLRAIRAAMPPGALGIEKELADANVQVNILGRQLSALRGAGHNFMGVGGGRGGVAPLPAPGGARGGGGHGGRIHGGNVHVGPHGFGVGGVGMGLASDMLVPLAAAGVAVYVGHQFYEASKDYEMAFARFKTLNLGDVVNKDADKFAKGTSQFGVSMTERMTMLRDMHEIMGNYDEAKAITPLFSRMLAANKGVYGEEGNKFDESTFQALGKVIEMRGGTKSQDEMFRQADYAQRVMSGSAGLVTPTDMLAFAKTGGVAGRLLSNKAFYAEAAPMIQEMGGSRFGTALMSAHQNLAMGRGTLQSMREASRIGIIDPKMIEYTTIGTIKRVMPGALKDAALFDSSPYEYLLKDLIPAIREKGVVGAGNKVITGSAITDEQIVSELNLLLSNRTGANAFSQMYLQRDKIAKNVGVTQGAMGIDDLEKVYKGSPAGAEAEFDAAWTDFKTQFGKTMLPAITNMLLTGANILRTIAGAAQTPMVQSASSFTGGVAHAFAWPYRAISSLFSSSAHAEDNPHASTSVAGASSGAGGNVHTTINMDGRKVAQAVTPYMAGPLGSGLYVGGIDNNVSLPMPALK